MAFARRIFLFLIVNIAFIVVLTVLLYAVEYFTGIRLSGSVSGGFGGLFLFALIVGFAGSFFSLAISRWIAKRTYDIRLLSESERFSFTNKEQLLYTTVADLARQNGISMPEVGIYDSEEPNAFATGPSRNTSLLAVSTGLLDTLSTDEVTGVIGHEMSHILNGDMVTMTLLQGILNTFVIFLARVLAYGVDLVFGRSDEEEGMGGFAYFLLTIFFEVVLGIFASLILMAYSRSREYRADAGSTRLLGRDPMIHALTHLKALESISADTNDTAVAAFKIAGGRSWLGFMSSHPDMDDRIARLRGMTGV